MRFKKFKSRYGQTRRAEGTAPTPEPEPRKSEPAPSDEYLRSMRQFHENEDFDQEDEGDDDISSHPLLPPDPPPTANRRTEMPPAVRRPSVAEVLAQNKRKGGRRPIGPPRKNSIAPEGYMTLQEAAPIFGMSYWTVRKWAVDDGYFGEVLKAGRRIFVACRAVYQREREWEAQLAERARQFAEQDDEPWWE